jgi:hypothetical protein
VLLRVATTGRLRVVAAGDGGEVAAAFRGLPALLRRARTCVLLGRGATVPAEVLGRRPVPAPGPGPGVGFVVVDGEWTAVRLAVPHGTAARQAPVPATRWARDAPLADAPTVGA